MRSDAREIFKQTLSQSGLKLTRQRERVFDYVLTAAKHSKAQDIYEALKKKDASIGRATVFRTLRLLEKAGFADRLAFENGCAGYENKFARAHHDHMICVECRKVIEFYDPSIEQAQKKAARKIGFETLWHRHEIFGKCRRCRSSL
jgi:Fur family ferric uptake transcriptional regulator